jgi:hypothetical protein
MPTLYPRRLDVVEMCQEAAERAGIEFRSGYALTTARRSLELLSIEWANRGLNLWCLDRIGFDFGGTGTLVLLPEDTVDVLDVTLYWYPDGLGYYSVAKAAYPLERIGLGDVSSLSQSRSAGDRPTGFYVNRMAEVPTLHLSPAVPQEKLSNYRIECWRLRYMMGLDPGGTDTPELPFRFLPAMIAGLAYYLALKSKEAAAQARVAMLKSLYEEEFDLASQEDRDRSNFHFVPDVRC